MTFILMGFAATLASVAAFRFLDYPVAWTLAAWALLCFTSIRMANRRWVKIWSLNAGVGLVVIAIVEVWLGSVANTTPFHDVTVDEADGDVARAKFHPLLGYAPEPGTYDWKRFVGDDLIFYVRYEIDPLGLRVSPKANSETIPDCVFFFGGSFTFGPGVQDEDTFAYQVGSRHPALQVYNFGYSGYGPHQMLAAVERGAVIADLDCQRTRAIYLALPDHARRIAGKAVWDPDGPWYQLDNGRPVYRGSFRERSWLAREIPAQARKSPLASRALLSSTEDDLDLLVSASLLTEELLNEGHAGRLDILVWDRPGDGASDRLIEALRSSGLTVHVVGDILPGDRSTYILSEHDKHPNLLAHSMLADYVGLHILGR